MHGLLQPFQLYISRGSQSMSKHCSPAIKTNQYKSRQSGQSRRLLGSYTLATFLGQSCSKRLLRCLRCKCHALWWSALPLACSRIVTGLSQATFIKGLACKRGSKVTPLILKLIATASPAKCSEHQWTISLKNLRSFTATSSMHIVESKYWQRDTKILFSLLLDCDTLHSHDLASLQLGNSTMAASVLVPLPSRRLQGHDLVLWAQCVSESFFASFMSCWLRYHQYRKQGTRICPSVCCVSLLKFFEVSCSFLVDAIKRISTGPQPSFLALIGSDKFLLRDVHLRSFEPGILRMQIILHQRLLIRIIQKVLFFPVTLFFRVLRKNECCKKTWRLVLQIPWCILLHSKTFGLVKISTHLGSCGLFLSVGVLRFPLKHLFDLTGFSNIVRPLLWHLTMPDWGKILQSAYGCLLLL